MLARVTQSLMSAKGFPGHSLLTRSRSTTISQKRYEADETRIDAPSAYSEDPWVDVGCGFVFEEAVRVEREGVLPAREVVGQVPA